MGPTGSTEGFANGFQGAIPKGLYNITSGKISEDIWFQLVFRRVYTISPEVKLAIMIITNSGFSMFQRLTPDIIRIKQAGCGKPIGMRVCGLM